MDLYMQVGVLLVMASMFALVAYFYSVSTMTGLRIGDALDKPSVNYSLDSSVTSPTFFVDSRVFPQWAINAKGQRDVFLVYPSNITPDATIYGEYLRSLVIDKSDADPSHRKLIMNPKVPQYTNNALHVLDQAPKTIDYLTLYAQTAKAQGQNKMVTVYTFTDTKSSEVIYICYIK